ncbi:very short patch repair endonuclease [Bradyrhizobium sp. HKCCYLRH1065]|uniref:very short patch repair endonuclease n=1 Tax=unclassified Bradyrhizobium TaxID=2631580 RepID=UPI003EB8A95D
MDNLTPAKRSANMSRIRGVNTRPELQVRKLLFSLGYRYRLHARDVLGRPDIVFKTRRAAIFVHGCFWHRHNCGLAYSPKSRTEFWQAKFTKNIARDRLVLDNLRAAGWRVKVIWQCELRDLTKVTAELKKFLGPPNRPKQRAAR